MHCNWTADLCIVTVSGLCHILFTLTAVITVNLLVNVEPFPEQVNGVETMALTELQQKLQLGSKLCKNIEPRQKKNKRLEEISLNETQADMGEKELV